MSPSFPVGAAIAELLGELPTLPEEIQMVAPLVSPVGVLAAELLGNWRWWHAEVEEEGASWVSLPFPIHTSVSSSQFLSPTAHQRGVKLTRPTMQS